MKIEGPRQPSDYPERPLDCEAAMEHAFLQIMNCAMKSGWADIEAVSAINSLADHFLLSQQANAETEAAVQAVLKRHAASDPSK